MDLQKNLTLTTLQTLFRSFVGLSPAIAVQVQNTYIYSLNFADDQILLTQDHDDMEYMARKLKEEYEKWGLTINLEKNQVCMYV